MGPALLLILQLGPAAMGFFDKSAMFGEYAIMLSADLDGDPSTADYAGWDYDGTHAGEWRTAIIKNGQVCVSPYIPQSALVPNDPGVWYYLNLQTMPGRRSVLQVQSGRWIKEFPLPVPSCKS